MKKVITRIVVLMFAFVLPFLFSGCDGTLNFTPQNKQTSYNSGKSHGSEATEEEREKTPNPEFYVEDGKYIYFSEFWEEIDGVRIASNPSDVNAGEGTSEQTKLERQHYFNDVYSQFELLYFYIKDYFLCEFDEKIADSTQTLTSGNYSATFNPFSPQTGTEFQAAMETEEQILEYNKQVGNTTSGMMDGAFAGWTISQSGGEYKKSYQKDERYGFVVNFKNGDEGINKNFIIIRLMEIVLNSETKTDYAYASNQEKALKRIKSYQSSFKGLGFSLGDVSAEGSIAKQIKTMLLKEVIGQQTLEFYENASNTFAEPMLDAELFDVNKNGVQDTSVVMPVFATNFDAIITSLVGNLSLIVDGTSSSDPNRYPEIISVEVQDYDSETYFEPGIAESETQRRTLTNMGYAEYKSIVFDPHITSPIAFNQRLTFQMFDIYVDAEEDFVLDLYLKVYLNADNYFVCHVCSLNFDSTKSCDWSNDENEKEYANPYDEFFDTDTKHNGYNWVVLEEMFKYIVENRSNDYVLKCSNPGSQTDDAIMNAMVNMPYGGGKILDENTYDGRGYHTSRTDNTALAEKYAYQEINKNGDTALCYVPESNESYVEFIFVIPNRDATKDYNFKFLIMPEEGGDEEDEE